MTNRAFFAAALIAIAAISPVCTATDSAVRSEGRRLFLEAGQLIRQDRYEAACERFERCNAYIIRDSNLWNIAMCHVHFGRRDLALAGFEIYLEHAPEVRASLEIQNLLWELEGQPPIMPDAEATQRWADRMSAAARAARDRGAATVPPEQQTYGAGTDSPGAPVRREVVRRHGTQLFEEGLVRLRVGDWDGALALWERSLTYRTLRNAAFNIGTVHLSHGRRDLALYFFRRYVESLPVLQQDQGVREALQAIEDAPATIRAQEARDQLNDRFNQAVTRALGTGEQTPRSP